MAFNNINFGNKTLNYNSFKKLFQRLQKVENIEKTTIYISYNEKKNELKKIHNQTFDSICKLLENVKDLNKIDNIEVEFLYKNFTILLKYGDNHFWELVYTNEDNVSNAIKFILYDFFKPNFFENIFIKKTFILWIIWWGLLSIISSKFGDVKVNSPLGLTMSIIIFLTCSCLILVELYKFIIRTKPYRNNKFWEEHKIEIIQNIIFYLLGVITPYIITYVSNLINI